MIIDIANSGQTVDLPAGFRWIELRLAENPDHRIHLDLRRQWGAAGSVSCLSDQFRAANRSHLERAVCIVGRSKGASVGECDISMQYRRSFSNRTAGGKRLLQPCTCASRNDRPRGRPIGREPRPCVRALEPGGWSRSRSRALGRSGRRRAWVKVALHAPAVTP